MEQWIDEEGLFNIKFQNVWEKSSNLDFLRNRMLNYIRKVNKGYG